MNENNNADKVGQTEPVPSLKSEEISNMPRENTKSKSKGTGTGFLRSNSPKAKKNPKSFIF